MKICVSIRKTLEYKKRVLENHYWTVAGYESVVCVHIFPQCFCDLILQHSLIHELWCAEAAQF